MPRTSSWNAAVHRCGFSILIWLMTSMPKFRWMHLVAQDVLVLLGDADHLVAAAERQDLREIRYRTTCLRKRRRRRRGRAGRPDRPPACRSGSPGSSRCRVCFSAQAALSVIEGTSRYMLNSSPSSRPRLSTMYWNVWVCTASSNDCRSRYCRHSGLVRWR